MPIKDLTKRKNVSREIAEKICYFLNKTEFLNIATCDFSGRPNVAPKFLVKVEGTNIYLADYVFGRTFINIKNNPRVSLSAVNLTTLTGYQINGTARIIASGPELKRLIKEMQAKQVKFSASRLIEGLHKETAYKDFEVTLPEKACIFKIKIEEVAEIGRSGKIHRRKYK
ncbi:MAG: pyridoxamine 5'-phosphate oxidase family protein [Candidatus Omnitrophica bacterium]|nr:pyridoxamine 5'-phosphate oxidase family protein [Candidatus Omnitrophota bacterium]